MIIDRIDPIALRVPFERRTSGAGNPAPALHLLFCRVTTRSGLVGYGESLCMQARMQESLAATIGDIIAPLFVGQSVEQRQALNLETRRRFASFGRAGTILNALIVLGNLAYFAAIYFLR